MRERMLFDVFTPEEPTFRSFVPEGNEEALSAVRALAERDGRAGSALLLWGPPGCGKSHLLRAALAAAESGGRATGDVADGGASLPGLDLAVADDVERLGEGGQERLFSAIDSNRLTGHPAVLATSQSPPMGLALREDLRTRLGACVVIGLRRLDDEAKRRALAAYARRIGREVDPAVVDHLLKRHPRNLGRLLAVFREMDRHAVTTGDTLNLRTAREWEERHPGEAG